MARGPSLVESCHAKWQHWIAALWLTERLLIIIYYCNSLTMVFRSIKEIVSNTSRMLLLELLSRLQNSNTSLLFWNFFTGLQFLNEYKIISLTYKILNTTLWPHIYSTSSWSQHTLFTIHHFDKTNFITQSPSSLLPTCFTLSLEPASYITQDSSSNLFTPLSATFIPSVFTVSFWA